VAQETTHCDAGLVCGWLQVVKARAENMAACAKMGDPHGMLTVVGLGDADLENICKTVRFRSSPPTWRL
jgi:hypothetical protein